MSCTSNIFGEPGKGIHQYRLFNIAIVDTIMTIFLALLISWYLKLNFLAVLLLLLILGEFMHILFCVKTPISKIFM